MKIVFLCCSLEPGADGVGDYTRRLAGELSRNGHAASIVALHDAGITGIQHTKQSGEGVMVPVLRLSHQLTWPERVAKARDYIGEQAPDWLSLQFVCFGFHPKGLVFEATPHLKAICSPHRTHLMFHELWVGLGRGASWRFRIWGLAQRLLILRFYRKLRPRVTHTNTEHHVRTLHRHSVEAALLPLFGNIPVRPPSGWFKAELERLGISGEARTNWVLFGIFGTIHRTWSADDWLEHLLEKAAATNRRVAILGIGRVDGTAMAKFQAMAEAGRGRLLMHHFREQSDERISEFLQSIDAGLSTMDRTLLGKSGTAAAMREHGVPVLVTRVDDAVDPDHARAQVRHEIDLLMQARRLPRTFTGESMLTKTARSMLDAMAGSEATAGPKARPQSNPGAMRPVLSSGREK